MIIREMVFMMKKITILDDSIEVIVRQHD